MAIGKEPGDSTMIRVTYEVKQMIEEEKLIPREPLNDCIKRGILESRKFRGHPRIETKESLSEDMTSTVINPSYPAAINILSGHREIWQKFHPNDVLTEDDIIHHINGNPNDNRIENLQKTTKHGHAVLHTPKMYHNSPDSKNVIIGRDV